MNRLLIIFLLLCAGLPLRAQQDPMFTTYMFNSLLYNPAYAGSQGNWDLNATYRRQWMGIDGSPGTILLSGEGALPSDRIGLGLTLFHDRIGIERRTDVSTNYAYIIDMPAGRLMAGIKAGLAMYRLNFSDLQADPSDPYYATNPNAANLYFGPGLMFQTDVFYAGLSSPNLLSVDLNGSDPYPAFVRTHVYLHTGAWLDLNGSGLQLRPSLLVSYQAAAPLQLNVGAALLFNQYLSAGLSYRTGDAITVAATIYPNPDLRIGLSYDFTLSELRANSMATFDLMVGYSFGEQVTKIVNPR